MPVAVTEKDAVCPVVTVSPAGCAVMAGGAVLGELRSMYAEHPEVSVASRKAVKKNANPDGLAVLQFLRARTDDRFPKFRRIRT